MIIKCPHCCVMIEIVELRCRIFRCGVYINTHQQIDPHLSKEKCLQLSKNNQIYGCGMPFRILLTNKVEMCGYI